jgi:Cu/Ag efflux pump CusA
MVGSTIVAITLVPVLCTFLIRGKLHREEENPVMRVLRAIYKSALSWALRPKVITLGSAFALFCAATYTATTIGSEFMKPLAAPVPGGMVSSLIHVLIVPPLISTWLREREIQRGGAFGNG